MENAKYCPKKNKPKFMPWNGFLLGFLCCLTIMSVLYALRVHYNRSHDSRLLYGWRIVQKEICDGERDIPVSFDFRRNIVDIELSDGRQLSCKYSTKLSTGTHGSEIVIYDFMGEDLKLEYSYESSLHITLPEDAINDHVIDYHFSG